MSEDKLITKLKELHVAASPGPWRNDEDTHVFDVRVATVWGPEGPGHGCIVTAYPCYPAEAKAT